MKLKKPLSVRIVLLYLALAPCMLFMGYTLPKHEPLSFILFFAALSVGLNPAILAAEYLLSSVAALSWFATLSCSIQAVFLLLVFSIYRRLGRKSGIERFLYLLVAQLPFIFLFPHTGYAFLTISPILQKAILSLFFCLAALLAEGALSALLFRAFRCRLSAGSLAEISLMWLFLGMGIHAVLSSPVLYLISLTALLLAVVLLKNAGAVAFSAVLSLPFCLIRVSLVPLAEYVLLSSAALLFIPYGKPVAALSLTLAFTAIQYFEGLFAKSIPSIVFTLLACAIPAIVICAIPEKLYRKARHSLLFYRENPLPRIAVNRNRRAVGERLYEVSGLFREIESAFIAEEKPDDTEWKIKEKITTELCAGCPRRKMCKERGERELDKLVAVGKAKGRVNLVDVPAVLSATCENTAGLLFSLNKHLSEYHRYLTELDAAREGRRLLAEQAHGVSVILKNIALEQSEEYVFSDSEQALSAALAAAGILSTEIFIYGQESNLTVTLTLDEKTDTDRLLRTASEALGTALALAEKIPLTADRVCFVLKRKPVFDATFGLAAVPKKGEQASGDTHSILKIDERRFLVALSDGMGSGENARKISDKTLSLLESFYKAKMPSDTVLSTVNRLVVLSSEESFSCLDAASVNLDTGCADLVKIGSPIGFLMSGDELKLLEGDSLPLGALDAVRPAVNRIKLNANDFLIFMSDGVTTAFGSSAELCAYLSALRPLNPQSLAEGILNEALGRYGGKAEDDMTVLTLKLVAA